MLSQKFKACMWKTYRARRSSKVLTLLEILFPVLLFGVLSFVHYSEIKKLRPVKETNASHLGESYNMERLVNSGFKNRNNVDILFSPFSNFTLKIMDQILVNIFQKHNIDNKIRTFQGMAKEEHIVSWLAAKYYSEDITKEAKAVGYGFVFQHEERQQTTDALEYVNLDYKILCSLSTIKTNIIFPTYTHHGTDASGETYINSGIAVLQWQVEKAMIDLLHGEPVPFELELHSFPHPKEVQDEGSEFMYLTILLPVFTMMSFIFFIPVVIRRVVQEKSTGVKELMKIMGLNSWYLWSSWLIHCSILFLITTTFVTSFLTFPVFGSPAFLDYVDPSIVWLLFFLFCLASVIFCFAVTTLFNSPVAAMSCGVILWIGTFTLLNQLVSAQKIHWIVKLVICIFPTAAITNGFNIIAFYDDRNERLTWSQVFDSHPESDFNLSMIVVLLMLLVDMVLYGVITWYFDYVKPGPFGIARSWNFLCKILKKKKAHVVLKKATDYGTYEAPSPYLKVGIYVDSLRKVYKGDIIGLDGVSMNLYKDVITVLLGHNGAGKTSLMGIISGLHSPTSGSVVVGGEDIFSNMKKFRRNLGICFQYNYLFTYLNVLEHFIFFGMVKGMGYKRARSEGLEVMKEMHLMEKKNNMVHTLSGGMLRRLSLAIALIGNPKVLLLDEPTSGMDPETRRDVWDLILKKRGKHTIVITTQFMEEADVLGDWVAILDHGKLVCYGTTPFLKKIYGTGYHLTISKEKRINDAAITSIIKKHVPHFTTGSSIANQVSYTLPLEATSKFPAMFAALEDERNDLGIVSIGIQCTTIEEVFLKVSEILQGPKSTSFTSFLLEHLPKTIRFKDNLKGSSLRYHQFKALVVKTLIFDLRNLLLLLFMALIPVAVALIAFPSDIKLKKPSAQTALKITLKMYGNTNLFCSSPVTPKKGLEEQYKKLQHEYQTLVESFGGKVSLTDNVIKDLEKLALQNSPQFRKQTIVSAAIKEHTIQAFYNNIPLHALPISTNLVTNTLLRFYFPNSDLSITFTYAPIDVSSTDDPCVQVTGTHGDSVGHQWAISMPQCLLCVMAVFLLLPAVERSCQCKHFQIMTGVPPLLYWLACFLWDYFLYTLVTLLLVITIILSDKHHIFSSPLAIGILVLILLLYGISGTFYAYFSSNFGSSASRIIGNYLVFSICFGMVSAILVNLALKRENQGEGVIPTILLQLLRYTLVLCPHYCLVSAFILFGGGAFQNYMCKSCTEHICKEEKLLVFNSKENKYGMLLELAFLGVDWMLYLILLIMTENKIFHNLYWKYKNSKVDVNFDEDKLMNSDVQKEGEKTLACSKDRSVDPKAFFMSVGLGKVYSNKSMVLQPTSFRVRRGECFGLLGTNGAGKSTTFKMLVGEMRPTVGDAINFNHTLMRNRRQYLKKIGYCPQVGALNLSFTGDETLRLYAQLRGVHPRRVDTEVDNWVRLLGLGDYRSQLCSTYSSGNLRKLSTAIALIGHPPVVFLDEPSAGVDPFGRRNLWEVLNASKDLGQAVLLTSHSMQECEALCTRLTILVNGRMMCLGNIQYLKKKFGQGYTAAFVLSTVPELQQTLPAMKAAMYKTFARVKLKDEHKKLLHFHVKDMNIRLSELFKAMEELKQTFSVIESYTLEDTTLEQVFISFAKAHIKPEIIL